MTKKNKNNWTDRLRASVFPNPSKGKSKTLKKKKKKVEVTATKKHLNSAMCLKVKGCWTFT